MAVSVKMGVDVSGFRTGIQQAQNSVRTLDAELKKNEAQFKATGNSEQYMADKSKLLNQKLGEQKKVVDETQKALKAMTDAGIKPTDKAYQDMERTLLNAQTAMYTTQAAMNEMGTSAANACKGADQLTQSVNNIGKKVSLDAVIGGINTITSGLENAAKKAVSLGQTIFNEIVDSARWADDTATMAQMYDVPLEKLLQMQALVATGMDTSVDAILGSMQKMKKSVGKESAETMNTLKQLGLVATQTIDTGFMKVQQDVALYQDANDLFWKAGKAIMNMSDSFDKEAAAQAVFGKSWRELIPLFTQFDSKESFNEALESMNINSEEAVTDLAKLNDALGTLQNDFNTLKREVLAGLAPALTDAANALSGMLTSVMDYLKKPEGKQMLDDLGDAVSGLFDDLSKIDPEAVVSGFVKVFDTIISGLQWMVDNKSTLEGILVAIVTAWGAAKLGGGALQVLQLVSLACLLRGKQNTEPCG